jgi:tetratricopeptide (TPR) repeat protein
MTLRDPRRLAILLLSATLSGCAGFPGSEFSRPPVAAAVEPVTRGETPPDLAYARTHFAAGRFGLAELHFRRAVETGNRDPQAWLGLAASYDRLRRNDLADRAYAQARQAGGETSAWLNNRGYSWMQRGDTRRASEALSKAATLDPENPLIRDNLATLETRVSRRR